MLVGIESFSYSHVAQTDDINYTLQLKQWKIHNPIELVIPPPPPPTPIPIPQPNPPPPPAYPIINTQPPPQQIRIGSIVILNGQLHLDSYGSGPGSVRSNWKGKVLDTRIGRKCPYHVGTQQGAWAGWVKEGTLQVVG